MVTTWRRAQEKFLELLPEKIEKNPAFISKVRGGDKSSALVLQAAERHQREVQQAVSKEAFEAMTSQAQVIMEAKTKHLQYEMRRKMAEAIHEAFEYEQ